MDWIFGGKKSSVRAKKKLHYGSYCMSKLIVMSSGNQ